MKQLSVSLIVFIVIQILGVSSWGSTPNKDKVLLEKLTAITLTDGKMTNGRRSSPVQQLDCVGGSAGCYNHRPNVVQCTNVGFDGYDVQWECKADLDNAVRFGQIEVSCEGYEYPDDPYILRGSCGLRYQLELTNEGRRGGNNYGGHDGGYHSNTNYNSSGGSWFGTLFKLFIAGVIIYFVLGACFGRRHSTPASSSSTAYANTGGTGTGTGSGGNGGGWWSGAATGGMLGYLFGSRNRNYGYGSGYGGGWGSNRGWGSSYGGNSGWGSRSGGGGWSSGSRSSGGSRSSSGFGGTSRR